MKPIIGPPPDTEPTSRRAAGVLTRTDDSAAFIHLCPGHSEGTGSLLVGSISADGVDLASATLALWKLQAVALEEWPYEPWSPERAARVCSGDYAADYSRYGACAPQSIDSYLSWVNGRARKVVHEYRDRGGDLHTRGDNLNPAFTHPGPEAVEALDLAGLTFLTPAALRVILLDSWNDTQGIFQLHRRYYYINWWTTA